MSGSSDDGARAIHPLTAEAIRRIGLDAGLAEVGITTADPFPRTLKALEERKAAGIHGGMQFTYRNPPRSTDISVTIPEATSLVVGAWAYNADARPPDLAGDRARIAAYAWRDHYGALREALGHIADALQSQGHLARIVSDDNALVDRAAAVRAGIGWFGKNSNVLLRRRGSYFVLGAVVTDAVLATDPAIDPACGTCRRCLDGCPTGAIVAEGVVDARRCLAWLLQAAGTFPREFRQALGNRIYGCDDCQEVCPPNRTSSAPLAGDEISSLDLIELLTASDERLLELCGRWYIPQRDLDVVRRNALVCLGNSGAPTAAVHEHLQRYLAHVNPILRVHAAWAADQLGLGHLLDQVADDQDPMVVEELVAQGRR